MKTLAAIVLLAAAWPCTGQQGALGELTGVVRSGGQALSGATVTLACGALQGNRATATGENGGFLFSLLPPGDCVVRVDLQGFASAEKQVTIALAETTRADVELSTAS